MAKVKSPSGPPRRLLVPESRTPGSTRGEGSAGAVRESTRMATPPAAPVGRVVLIRFSRGRRIPSLKIADRGLVDVDRFELVSLAV